MLHLVIEGVGGVHARLLRAVLVGHVARRLAGHVVRVGDADLLLGLAEAAAAVGVVVEDLAHLGAGERLEAPFHDVRLRGQVVRCGHLGRQAELRADFGELAVLHAAARERVEERLLDADHLLGRERDVVEVRLRDMVVDLVEDGVAMFVGPDDDISGVVVAGRDGVEMREREVDVCHVVAPLGETLLGKPYLALTVIGVETQLPFTSTVVFHSNLTGSASGL